MEEKPRNDTPPWAEATDTRLERERLVAQMQQANENLIVAAVRAEEAADRAAESERAKDAFLAMLGHELRNPLSPILTAVELMEIRAPGVCERERGVIDRQVHHIVRLVDELLDVARIGGGKVVLQCEVIELSDVVTSAIEMARPIVDAKHHELVRHVPMTGMLVYGDPFRLAQVAANLINNAAKYTPHGGRIIVSATRRAEMIALGVKDNGIGISPEMLPRIFDMFTQETQALDRAQGGLGLGLSIVKTLVGMHRGNVTAHSAGHGTGSEFIVEIPSFDETATSTELAATAVIAVAVTGLKILVVDDDVDTADVTGHALSLLGHDVRVAYDGRSAVAALDDFHPNVAVLDIGLPGMDGYELAEQLRNVFDDIRFVALSGYGRTNDRDRSLHAGFAKHLVKPINVAMLQDALR